MGMSLGVCFLITLRHLLCWFQVYYVHKYWSAVTSS